MTLTGLECIYVGLAGLAAGLLNALAGGGTLISFPTLMLLGLPPVSANVTNTVALCPGYLGATLAQWNDLRGQRKRLLLCLPAGILGGVVGGLLLLATSDRAFMAVTPYLILLATGLLAVQEPLRARLLHRNDPGGRAVARRWAAGTVVLAALYGGYFGAGLSVIVLAALALTINDTFTRLNALKQAIVLVTNLAAAVYFLFSDRVEWTAALVLGVGAIVGGTLGGRLASRIRPKTLRAIVVAIGTIIGLAYLIR